MNESPLAIKLAFITGLREVVLKEIGSHSSLHINKEKGDFFYLNFVQDLTAVKRLGSVSRAYIVLQNLKYNPSFISTHKSILGDLIELVISENKHAFKTFKITCAGSTSPEVRRIAEYIQETYRLIEKEDADMKIHVVKLDEIWEIGIQLTPRPLSFRDYKIKNMSGAMDPTIAYAVNSLCELEKAHSYLNIFSGSGTLLIEAGQRYPNLKQLIGFDNNKTHISLAMQNIKKAGLIKQIQLKEKNIFDRPDLGRFDVITSDLPFGMSLSKGEDMEQLYQCFIEYCQETLNRGGKLAIYTSEHEILRAIILKSRFKIVKTLDLKLITSVNAYLRPKIFVCRLK
ncbi:MAG: methyltransferase domain-containing protein, partial [Candidatus Azambacteria bacterium]|nr:methyltransferase domain-containing protein [Candidatus Azambacteria bacterium]